MAHIKAQLLECLIRECIREILDQTNEVDGGEPVGAAAPSEDGLGTADQPSISQGAKPMKVPTKGIILVNPKDTEKLQSLPLRHKDDAQLERDLFRVGSLVGGPKVKMSMNAMRMVKDGITNPSSPVYVYIGKYDPESEELFIMADKDLNVAKSESAASDNIGGKMPDDTFHPMTADAGEFANKMQSGGQAPRSDLDELKKSIKRMVREVFTK